MKHTLSLLHRHARQAGPRGHAGSLRRLIVVPVLGISAALVLLLSPALASADTATTVTAVGTSDVNDSGLIPSVIIPQFKTAFPQYTFHYLPSATGAAIQAAENGTGGPSVLIVHAASLENQFVADGFSQETYGRAIFTNDFVLAGGTDDPAHVLANDPHDAAQAFRAVATAGINGGGTPKATFVSRGGGATASGTTVEEHAIWALVNQLAAKPAGLVLCKVSDADGGGMTPIAPNNGEGITNGQDCPAADGGTVTGADLPTWEVVTGANQGTNVLDANACNGFPSSGKSCYVLTDRGTYDYLASGTDPAGSIPNLEIVTRDNSASALGGSNLLINYFHAYIINPAKPGETVNLQGGKDFLNFLTSPGFQGQLKSYLNTTSDPGGAPFKADASPILTASTLPAVTPAGQTVTVTGQVTNAQPGFPAPSGKTVTLNQIQGGLAVPVATGTTTSTGAYSISFVPRSSGTFQVTTAQIAQIENTSLNPVYGDLLSPAAATPSTTSVQGAVSISSATAITGGATVTGTVAPGAPDSDATVTILARPQGSTGSFQQVGGSNLSAGQATYAANAALGAGNWEVQASYRDPGQLVSATSASTDVTVASAGAGTAISFKKVKVKNGKLTVNGALKPAAGSSGGKIELLAMKTVKLGKKKHTVREEVVARVAAASLKQVSKKSVSGGTSKFTIKANLKRGYSWVVQLGFVPKGQSSSFSKVKTVDVH